MNFKAKVFLLSLVFCSGIFLSAFRSPGSNDAEESIEISNREKYFSIFAKTLYSAFQTEELNYNAFEFALKGYYLLKIQHQIKNDRYLTIIDFTKSSTEKRWMTLDMEKFTIAVKTFVAHGRNSGEEFAQFFSNSLGSFKSSLGFFTTGEIYNGKNGLSMKLKGLESGINDLAYERGVVVHGADYVSPDFIANTGRLGRSQGCPALPVNEVESAVSLLKEGTLFFLYADNQEYKTKSVLLKSREYLAVLPESGITQHQNE